MKFEKGYLYHIYNQGNNRQSIFFNRENYNYFLKKLNDYILPYADILAWCLMPNHFHLMVLVNNTCLDPGQGFTSSEGSEGFTSSETLGTLARRKRTFNDSIGILLRTYTRAINKQYGMTGSLFRKETKAICINCFDSTDPTIIGKKAIVNYSPLLNEKQYPQSCFDYIHQNPIKANLVKSTLDWEFSSARDYAGLRNDALISKEVAREYLLYSGLYSGLHLK